MAKDQASGWIRGPSIVVSPQTLLAWLHGSLVASLVLATVILSWRGLTGALATPLGAGWLLVVGLWGVTIGDGWWWFSMRRKEPAGQSGLRIGQPRSVGDPLVTQQLRRDLRSDGREQVVGWMRVDLAAGQRVAQVHVAFCPPLEHAPAIELRQVAGPAARLKLGQSLAYGARFELKLAAPGPASITLEYTATTTAAREPKLKAEGRAATVAG